MKTAKVKFLEKSVTFPANSLVVYQYEDGKWIMSRAFPADNMDGRIAFWDHIADLQERGFKVTIDKDVRKEL